MNIADLIAALQRGEDPNQAIPAQFVPGQEIPDRTLPQGIRPEFLQSGFMPPIPQAAAAQASAPQPPAPTGPPQGIPTPVTNPQPANEVPKVTQSPPDLANMYVQLMQKNQNAAALDSGLTLIAAGLAKYPAQRAALTALAGGGQGAGKSITSADLINLQKHQQATKDMLLRRSMLSGLAKQYNLTPEAALALETSGKLDEVIKHHETQNLQLITDNATGQQHWADHKGKIISSFGGPKPPQGVPVKTEEGPTVFVNPQDAQPIGAPIGGLKLPPTQVAKGPQGDVVINTQTGLPVGPSLGLPPTTEQQNIEAGMTRINAERVAAGQPPLTTEQYMRTYGKSGVTVNVGAQGQQFPAPPPGQDYRRGPQGEVLTDAGTGEPTLYDLPGSDAKIKRDEHKASLEKKQQDIAAGAREVKELDKKDIEKARQRYAALNSVFAAADNVENIIKDAPWYSPAVGFASGKAHELGMRGAVNVRAQLETIGAVTAFNQLQAMRDASKTGAALGPVSDFENKMLKATIASIDPNQDPKYVLQGVRRIKAAMIMLAERDFKKEAGGDESKAQGLYNSAIDEIMADFEKKAGPQNIKGSDVRRVK